MGTEGIKLLQRIARQAPQGLGEAKIKQIVKEFKGVFKNPDAELAIRHACFMMQDLKLSRQEQSELQSRFNISRSEFKRFADVQKYVAVEKANDTAKPAVAKVVDEKENLNQTRGNGKTVRHEARIEEIDTTSRDKRIEGNKTAGGFERAAGSSRPSWAKMKTSGILQNLGQMATGQVINTV